ncbi:MAG: hypothetical protein HUK21_07660 [Fibrobacteraceae bacterium]|nr:hypothetical protein [Fibrobacteraceae bacterium]
MFCRICGRIVSFMACAFVLQANAQQCREVVLYGQGNTQGRMEESSRTFPEAPEWTANWGAQGSLLPPYVRLSGMRDSRSTWTGELLFNNLPVQVQGGNLRMKVRTSQNAQLGLWLVGNFGKSNMHTVNLVANQTKEVDVPLSSFTTAKPMTVSKVGIGLIDVPKYQYTTLFIGDVTLSCAGSLTNSTTPDLGATDSASSSLDSLYQYDSVLPNQVARKNIFVSNPVQEANAYYSLSSRDSLKGLSRANFVLQTTEHQQLQESLAADSLAPKKSRWLWYKNTYLINSHRLKDSVIANPKALFNEAASFGASTNYREVPLLVADLDYDYEVCNDTLCREKTLAAGNLLQAGLPTSYVKGSRIKIHYDPHYVVGTQREMPSVEICVSGQCSLVAPKSTSLIEFESAGIQKMEVKLRRGSKTVQQKIYVEVR